MPLSRAHGKTPREPWQYGDMALKEVKALKKEMARIKEENEILKKAMAIFATRN